MENGAAQDFFHWLDRYKNVEGGVLPKSWSHERMRLLVRLAGHPERAAPAIHVAGSKGKGSVTSMTAAILEMAGYRTLRFMSPHVDDIRERVMFGPAFLSDEVYARAGAEVCSLTEKLTDKNAAGHDTFYGNRPDSDPPTYFELLTLFYFCAARHVNADVLTVETGMGGRDDPTNAVNPCVSVITGIELEHTEFLGTTIAEIAGKKAGIIKEGVPAVIAEQPDEAALGVFREEAARRNAPLYYMPDAIYMEDICTDRDGASFTLRFRTAGYGGPLRLSLAAPGTFHIGNAALAVFAVKTAFPDIPAEAIRRGLSTWSLPARFELLRTRPPVIADGAHTVRSTALCAQDFTALYGGEDGTSRVLLFGCALDKDAQAMAGVLVPLFNRIVITAPGSFKASDPAALAGIFEAEARKQPGTTVVLIPGTEDAITAALHYAESAAAPLLCTGSFYLAAALRRRFTKNVHFS